MSLLSYHPLTPSKRQLRKVIINYPENSYRNILTKFKNSRRFTLSGRRAIHGVRYFSRTLLHKFFVFKPNLFNFIVTNFGYSKLPQREFVYVKTLYNVTKLMINNPCFYPGFILKNFLTINQLKELTAQIVPLSLVPLNVQISWVFNILNKKPTFAKSSGTYATKRKLDKKTKLFFIILPSQQQQLLPKHIYCTLAPTCNLLLHKRVEGKWGTYFTTRKVINVRGVAQNPVDHPNGGRTKAKQPELSPWGWIAKLNK